MKVFFDTSAFVKRYIKEQNTSTVRRLCQEATAVGLSVICIPEVYSAFNRLIRQGDLTVDQYDSLKQALHRDERIAEVQGITPAIVNQACRVLELHPLRAADAIHIGCALEWGADQFATSDLRQMQAADKENLHVIPV